MANTLNMATIHTIQGLLEQGWSHRRIARELGIHRETVSRYFRILRSTDSKPAISTLGLSPPGRLSHCRSLRSVILGKLEQGLSGVRIFQDLRQESGFAGSYSSVKRFVRRLNSVHPLPFRRIETGPGEEAQVDFGQGAWTLKDGKKRRPHILRICLSYSRKCYSEVVWQQTTESFIRSLENAFRAFGGVPKRLVIDNLKAAVTKADWFDPELNPKIAAFARHYGIVILPTRPAMPRHKGKIESGVKYVQNNALKGRVFDRLVDQNAFLVDWEGSIADTRIHGTTRRQVRALFVEEKPSLAALPMESFPFFHEAKRKVHRDAHAEIQKAYYSVPPEYLGHEVWVRWDARIVRIYNERFQRIAVHARVSPGAFNTDQGHLSPRKISAIERGADYMVRKAFQIGGFSGRWAQGMLKTRGIEGIRVLQGFLGLSRKYSADTLNQASKTALMSHSWRLRTVRTLCERLQNAREADSFTETHPLIRPLSEYRDLLHGSTTSSQNPKEERV